MPQDPHLYGQPPPKKQKKEIALSGSLAFSSQLSSFLAEPSAKSSTNSSAAPTTGRTRPSKLKKDGLSDTKVKRKDSKANTETKDTNKLSLKSPLGTEDSKAEREFARRKMESKARLYAAMQRGDYIGREVGLVDFDRKWAESKSKSKSQSQTDPTASPSDSDSDSEPDNDQTNNNNTDTTLHEYTDEFGRVRQLTHAQILRLQRGAASATELEHMSARPKAPSALIYGDAVQTEAFAAAAHDGSSGGGGGREAMEALARKRDRSATPPEATHYEADWEIRTKGVGFYKFSRGEGKRGEEMQALEEERKRTEGVRREREEMVARRKSAVEERKREVLERRTKKMAESFLEGLERDLVGGDAG